LLLIHGVIDENVHLQNTLNLAGALQAAGKQFDLMLYPGNRHAVADPRQRRHLYTLMTDYVRKHL
jgi:dipeptidyl-peptidase-4